MEAKYLAVFLLLLISLISTASAQQYEYPDSLDLEYGDEVNFDVDKNSGDADISLRLEVCGRTAFEKSGSGVLSPGSSTIAYPVDVSFTVPDDIACGHGQKEMKVYTQQTSGPSEQIGSIDLFVGAKGDMNPHIADNLMLNYDPEDDQLHAFQLTDQTWDQVGTNSDVGSYSSTGNVMIQRYIDGALLSGGTRYIYQAEIGNKISKQGAIVDLLGDIGCEGTSQGQCDIMTREFGSNNGNVDMAYWSGLSTISPVHEDYKYEPDGQIVFGYYPLYYNQSGDTGQNINYNEDTGGKIGAPQFFICREGATMSNGFGQQVGQVVDVQPGSNSNQESLVQCSPDEDVWDSVNECEDGLDNDGDGNVDYQEDPNCGGNPEGSESSADCSNPVIAEDSNGNKAAFYGDGSGESPSSGVYQSCEYGSKQVQIDEESDANERSPVEFYCDENSPIEYNGPSYSRADEFCSNIFTTAQNPMPAVQYFIPKQAMPSGASEWVTSEGFKSTGFQTLHQAEREYSSTVEAHNAETWSRKDMQDIYGYEDGDEEFYEEAWAPANAGSSNDNVSSEGKLGKKSAFTGGYFGKCTDDKSWVYSDGEWRCDYPSDGQTITVNTYRLESDLALSSKYAGLQINRSQIDKWEDATGLDPSGADGANSLELVGECWHGGPLERPSNVDKRVQMTNTYNGGDLYLIGEIPRNTDAENSGSYSCAFGFQQEVTDVSQTTKVSDAYLFDAGDSAIGEQEGFIVEGTNQYGVINVRSERIPVPYSDDQYGDAQDWLEEYSGRTSAPNGDLYQNFPTGGTDTDTVNPNPAQQNRHPIESIPE